MHDTATGYEGNGLYGWQCLRPDCPAQGHELRDRYDADDQADAHRANPDG